MVGEGARHTHQFPTDNMRLPRNAPPHPRLDAPHFALSENDARQQAFTGMKGNPVHVVVDEGITSSEVYPTYVLRTILNFAQMD